MRTDRSLREGAKRHQARGLKRPILLKNSGVILLIWLFELSRYYGSRFLYRYFSISVFK